MQIPLTPEQEQFLQAQLQSGKYQTAQELISKAFELLEENEDLPKIPSHIRGSESVKKNLARKIKKFRQQREKTKNQPIDPEREKLSQELRQLFDETQSIPGIQDITEEEIAAEIEAYRRGE